MLKTMRLVSINRCYRFLVADVLQILPVMIGNVGGHPQGFGQILMVHPWLASFPSTCRDQVTFELYHSISQNIPTKCIYGWFTHIWSCMDFELTIRGPHIYKVYSLES